MDDETTAPCRYVIISGPTAAGKTRLALELARARGAEIVSADSMMVYRHMDIGTAKPEPGQMRQVPHHLIDILDPDGSHDAAAFSAMALRCIEDIARRGRLPLIVGGTGLYLRALERGLIHAPARNEELRKELSAMAEQQGSDVLYRELLRVDPGAEKKIRPGDLTRIIRALEIFRGTGKPASELRQSHGFRMKRGDSLFLVLTVPRKELRERIRLRAGWMIGHGLVEEVKKLNAMGYGSELKPMKALNYRHAAKYLSGLIGMEQLLWEIERDTWHFARKQLNWFRSEPDVHFVPDDIDTVDACVGKFLSG